MKPLLKIENLQTHFKSAKETVKAVNGISFSIDKGEILGIVGESGCGKSVTSLSIMQLIESPGEIVGGEVIFNDEDKELNLLNLSEKQLQNILGNKISMIFQDPMTSLNPVLTIGFQIAETLKIHRGFSKKKANKHSVELLKKVGITNAENRFKNYPHEFSGGMRQRVLIAMAIACQPKLLIADEPTTALDVTIQSQILNLLKKLKKGLGMSVIIITHDLGVVAQFADRVAVMYAGKIVETGTVLDILKNPQHPYAKALVASIPKLRFKGRRLPTIEGSPPAMNRDLVGCSFYQRCDVRTQICKDKTPILKQILPKQSAACFEAQNKIAH